LSDYRLALKWKVVLSPSTAASDVDIQRFLLGSEPYLLGKPVDNKITVLFDSESVAQRVARRNGEKLPSGGVMYASYIRPEVPKRPLGDQTRTIFVSAKGALSRPDDLVVAHLFQDCGTAVAIRYVIPPGKTQSDFEGEFFVEFGDYRSADRFVLPFARTRT
jgi:hypothetical protein